MSFRQLYNVQPRYNLRDKVLSVVGAIVLCGLTFAGVWFIFAAIGG